MSILEIVLISYIGVIWLIIIMLGIVAKGKLVNVLTVMIFIVVPPLIIVVLVDLLKDKIEERKYFLEQESESVEND